MYKWIDTHSHLYADKFDHDRAEVHQRAQDHLHAVVLPNINPGTVSAMMALQAENPAFFFPAIGLHPSDVKEDWETELATLKGYLDDLKQTFYAIGETGIDLYWDKTTLPLQQESLKVQIEWAKQYKLPIILHARNAIDETSDLIEAHLDENLTGIFHCFDGTLAQAERILSFGTFTLGIGGILTYRKDVQQMVSQVPLEGIVLETDSPYLPPVPHRKDKPRRNESSYTKYVGSKLAKLHGRSEEEVAAITNSNAQRIFHTADFGL